MVQNEIKELSRLEDERFENIFNLYLDQNDRYFYNLLQGISLPTNLPDGAYTNYVVEPGDTLPYISYKLFNTINLWWTICLANNIDNPTIKLEPGTELKIIDNNLLKLLILEINS
jgi:nucleoid-associated protein YgaU